VFTPCTLPDRMTLLGHLELRCMRSGKRLLRHGRTILGDREMYEFSATKMSNTLLFGTKARCLLA
jgi:hypothetical protein